MEHIYPAFERGRIMKKELLWALRDYAYSALQIKYQKYANGILSGCRIHPEGSTLRIAPGMIKCADFIFLITGEERVSYAPSGEYTSLKLRLKKKEMSGRSAPKKPLKSLWIYWTESAKEQGHTETMEAARSGG